MKLSSWANKMFATERKAHTQPLPKRKRLGRNLLTP
jgi:hypothetical protein